MAANNLVTVLIFCSLLDPVTPDPRSRRQAPPTSCLTPKNEQGTCISIRKCPPLRNLLLQTKGNGTSKDAEFLRKSVCKFSNGTSTVTTKDANVCCVIQKEEKIDLGIPNPPHCGEQQFILNKIIGGGPAEPGAWPWIARLGYWSLIKQGPVTWECGGALISRKYVLTAAHCTRHPTQILYGVRLGDLDMDGKFDELSPSDFLLEKIIPHEGYDTVKLINDIALARLKGVATYGDYIQPICLPLQPNWRDRNYNNLKTYVAGWGQISFNGPKSSNLQQVLLSIVPHGQCSAAYATKGMTIGTSQICAGESNKDSCRGDSGGPMMYTEGREFYLLGIVSYGYKCGEPGFPGIYTRVGSYINWIKQNAV